MSSYSSQYYSSTVPIPDATSKAQAYAHHYGGGYQSGGSTYSSSPPDGYDDQMERDASVTSYGGHGHHRHYHSTDSTTHGGYTTGSSGSGGGYYLQDADGNYYDYDQVHTQASASGVDFNEYIQDRFADSFDPIQLDRSLVTQAQTSGLLNDKHRELMDLQAKAQARLARSRARFAQGVQDAQEVRADLEWTSKKVSSLKKKAEKKHSKEYKKARERYPSPEY